VLYLYCNLDPSSPSSSLQVTEARKLASFYINRTKGFQNLRLTAGRSSAGYADIRHVGNRHSVCRHPRAELGPTVGSHESTKMSLNQVYK